MAGSLGRGTGSLPVGFCLSWLRELTGKMPVPLRFRLTPERFVKNGVKLLPVFFVGKNSYCL